MKLGSYLKLYLPAIGILVIVVLICLRWAIPVDVFMADPYDLLQGVPWVGLVSNLGVFVWVSALSICFFCATQLGAHENTKRQARLLWCIGIITTLVMLDDFFTLHELFYPGFLHLNEYVVTAFYAISLAGCLYIYRDLILRSEYLPLVLSFVFFALSVILDILSKNRHIPWYQLYEDGFKFLGIVSWLGYWAHLSSRFLNMVPKESFSGQRKPSSKIH